MVLQDLDASPQAGDSFDSAYGSQGNSDGYGQNVGGEQSQLVPPIDFSRLPQPFRVSSANVESMVTQTLLKSGQALQRPYSSEEANALALLMTKRLQIISYATPVGVAGGIWRSYTLRNQLKLPFWRPDPSQFSLYKFPMTKLEGQKALFAWRALQSLSYTILWTAWAKMFFVGYGTYYLVSNLRDDPRLEEYRNALGELSKRAAEGRFPQRQGPQPGSVQSQGSGTGSEASPWQQQQVQGSQASADSRQWGNDYRKQKQRDSDFVFDDASPTAGNPPDEVTPQNAWERLRRGQAPPQAPSQQANERGSTSETGSNAWANMRGGSDITREQRTGSTAGESFTFSKSDEEKELAQNEAQQQFDARIERERRGQDFNESKGRWS